MPDDDLNSSTERPADVIGGPGEPLRMWGGIECSTVRVRDAWRDQLRETGHHDRDADLDLVAGLGIRVLRYPLLWERVTDGHPDACGWAWHDSRLRRLGDLGVNVIGGLLHHGSGPATTDLLDPEFPEKLAAHAAAAASRYPFVTAWTPVNEPLTTARFSCQYGHWYPHARDEPAFLRALVNQCRAVLLSMRAIRAAAPGARLVQTEDLGRVFGTRSTRFQAGYENQRRWLSFDLLRGRVNAGHPLRAHLEASGVPARALDELASGEAAPDVIGINHYVTSDRFLDHRLDRYPAHLHGGNGSMEYADTEAARVDVGQGATGWEARLREAWNRYRLPLALTEVHLGCDDEWEQVRWLARAWEAAEKLRAEGADVRAVTAWALFGLVDWNTMLRERRGHYEPGVFDARVDPPRPMLLAKAVRDLARKGRHSHPAVREPGWWERDDRIHAELRRA